MRQINGSVVNSHSRWWQIVGRFIMWSRLSITACPWNLIMAGTGTCGSSAYRDSALSNWKERRLGGLGFKCETTRGRCASLIIWKMFYQKNSNKTFHKFLQRIFRSMEIFYNETNTWKGGKCFLVNILQANKRSVNYKNISIWVGGWVFRVAIIYFMREFGSIQCVGQREWQSYPPQNITTTRC